MGVDQQVNEIHGMTIDWKKHANKLFYISTTGEKLPMVILGAGILFNPMYVVLMLDFIYVSWRLGGGRGGGRELLLTRNKALFGLLSLPPGPLNVIGFVRPMLETQS